VCARLVYSRSAATQAGSFPVVAVLIASESDADTLGLTLKVIMTGFTAAEGTSLVLEVAHTDGR